MTGLYGERGIEPVSFFLKLLEERLSYAAYINYPSIFWCNSSDWFLQFVPCLGTVFALLALGGIFTGPMFFLCWLFYLSIVSVGQDFMSFQWDSLLLEVGLLSIWYAPWGLNEPSIFDKKKFELQKEPSLLFSLLLRLLCFKLMLFSGACKIASNDSSWRDLSAMTYHYESQPLPTPLAWLTQKLPDFLQRASTLMMFVVELILPISLISFYRPARILAAFSFIVLMLLIMITGNYAFFNWLTIALSITLLDDDALFSIVPRSLQMSYKRQRSSLKQLFQNTVVSLFPGMLIGSASLGMLWLLFDRYSDRETVPFALQVPVVLSQPLRSFNSYGLFAIMTRSRPEIIIEGSNDGKTWLAYEFKYKPGDLHRAPPIVAPHQPRLDWQMWFAALGPVNHSPWFDSFVKRLLEGSPEVLSLLDKNPFKEKPPALIRARLYDYHFSSFGELFSSGKWWTRTENAEFYPATNLEDLSYSVNSEL